MANTRITPVTTGGEGRIFEEGGGFDLQTIIFEIGVRFLYVIEGVAVIIIGVLVIRYVRSYLKNIQVTYETQRMALNLTEKLTTGFLIIVTATLALKVIGLDLTLLVSALTLGLSFALGDIIKNYVSGILILFKSPFAIGDVVKIKSFMGKVERIDFQSTTLKTFDKKEITIYNKDILARSIVNYSKEQLHRIAIGVTLGRGTDVQRALGVFEGILENHPQALKDPHFSIVFSRFSDSGIRFVIRFWVKKPINILRVRSEIALLIEQSFDEAKIHSPHARSIQFTQDVTMTEDRKQRLKRFYGLPMLAAVAAETAEKMETMFKAIPEEVLIDKEEPEIESYFAGETATAEED